MKKITHLQTHNHDPGLDYGTDLPEGYNDPKTTSQMSASFKYDLLNSVHSPSLDGAEILVEVVDGIVKSDDKDGLVERLYGEEPVPDEVLVALELSPKLSQIEVEHARILVELAEGVEVEGYIGDPDEHQSDMYGVQYLEPLEGSRRQEAEDRTELLVDQYYGVLNIIEEACDYGSKIGADIRSAFASGVRERLATDAE